MNPEVFTQFASPDPNASPLNLIQLVDLLNRLVSSQIQGSYLPYIIQSIQPGVDDQDKAWIELDTGGRPKSIKTFYNGHWRRVYNGMLGEVRGFTGAPGYSTTGPFDVNGLGIIGGDYDGWHIMNGLGGVPDLSNQFVCGANMRNADTAGGYDSAKGWETYIKDLTPPVTNAGGGTWLTILTKEHIPLPPLNLTNMDTYEVSGATIQNGGHLWGVQDGNTPTWRPIPSGTPPSKTNPYPPDGWVVDPTPPVGVFTAPPFYTLAWITFVGYQ